MPRKAQSLRSAQTLVSTECGGGRGFRDRLRNAARTIYGRGAFHLTVNRPSLKAIGPGRRILVAPTAAGRCCAQPIVAFHRPCWSRSPQTKMKTQMESVLRQANGMESVLPEANFLARIEWPPTKAGWTGRRESRATESAVASGSATGAGRNVGLREGWWAAATNSASAPGKQAVPRARLPGSARRRTPVTC
jgi:hypothetical protein